jgi:hypothetical protein
VCWKVVDLKAAGVVASTTVHVYVLEYVLEWVQYVLKYYTCMYGRVHTRCDKT